MTTSKFERISVPPGHYNSPGMRRLRAHPNYENIVMQTLADQERAMREVVVAKDAKSRLPAPDDYPLPEIIKG